MGKNEEKVDAAVVEPEEKTETVEVPTKVLYVETRFRQFLKAQGLNSGADIWEKADEVFRGMLLAACNRAKANGRKTLRAIDF